MDTMQPYHLYLYSIYEISESKCFIKFNYKLYTLYYGILNCKKKKYPFIFFINHFWIMFPQGIPKALNMNFGGKNLMFSIITAT